MTKAKAVTMAIFIVLLSIIFIQYYKYEDSYNSLNRVCYVDSSRTNMFILKALDGGQIDTIKYFSSVSVVADIINASKKNKLNQEIDFSYMCDGWDGGKIVNLIKKLYSDRNVSDSIFETEEFIGGVEYLNEICAKIK